MQGKGSVVDMFIGEYRHTLDEKGRIAVPAKLRYSKIGEEEYWVATKGFDHCLFVYPRDEWSRIIQKINDRLSLTKKEDRSFIHMFIFNTSSLSCHTSMHIKTVLKSSGAITIFIGLMKCCNRDQQSLVTIHNPWQHTM